MDYFTLLATLVILSEMLVPRSWNAATVARAIIAAATAYSDNSRPVSSLKNFLIISCLLRKLGIRLAHAQEHYALRPSQLFHGVGETGDLARDIGAEKLERCYGG